MKVFNLAAILKVFVVVLEMETNLRYRAYV